MFFFSFFFFFFCFLRRNTSSSPSSKNWDDSTPWDWLIENFSVCLGSDLDLDDFV